MYGRRDPADLAFIPHDLSRGLRRRRDTAPGADGIFYSILSLFGEKGRQQLLYLFNKSYAEGVLPAI